MGHPEIQNAQVWVVWKGGPPARPFGRCGRVGHPPVKGERSEPRQRACPLTAARAEGSFSRWLGWRDVRRVLFFL